MAMSLSNKMIVEKFLDEFNKRAYNSYIKYLADDIKWNIVGMPPINGKQNFLEALEVMEVWQSSHKGINSLAGGETHVIAEGDFVVIENQDFSLNKDSSQYPAHCDIYRINNGKIKEVITYMVDTSINE
jgi:ketosteroid isomerase-like protein